MMPLRQRQNIRTAVYCLAVTGSIREAIGELSALPGGSELKDLKLDDIEIQKAVNNLVSYIEKWSKSGEDPNPRQFAADLVLLDDYLSVHF